MKKNAFSFFVALAFTAAAHAVTLTGFGTDDFALDGSSSTITAASQDSAGYSFTANDLSGSFSGTFSSVNILTANQSLSLTALVSGINPASNFTIQLLDSTFKASNYIGNWGSFVTGVSSSIALTFTTADVGFNSANVIGMQIVFGGNGSGSLTIKLDTLSTTASAIPEPSTYAAIFGIAALGLMAVRRRFASK